MSLKRQNASQQQNQMPWHIFVHQIEREFEKYGKNTQKNYNKNNKERLTRTHLYKCMHKTTKSKQRRTLKNATTKSAIFIKKTVH